MTASVWLLEELRRAALNARLHRQAHRRGRRGRSRVGCLKCERTSRRLAVVALVVSGAVA